MHDKNRATSNVVERMMAHTCVTVRRHRGETIIATESLEKVVSSGKKRKESTEEVPYVYGLWKESANIRFSL